MKPLQTIGKMTLAVTLLAFVTVSSQAQKLASVQEKGYWAPDKVKIDGDISEWNNNFQAFNKTTGIYYTIANDKENLYLVIKSADQIINNKIIGGGVNFAINTDLKKKT